MAEIHKIVSVDSLSKSFDDKLVLADISFELKAGEILGLLGNNGTGKSTLINIMAEYISPDKGFVDVTQQENTKRYNIQFVTENFALFERLSLEDNLLLMAELLTMQKDIARGKVSNILQFLDLFTEKKTIAKSASFGMRKKLAIGATLLSNFDFGIYDEPFDGVDIVSRIKLTNLFLKLMKKGAGFLISTHDLYIIHKIASRYIILANTEGFTYPQFNSAEDLEKEFTGLHTMKDDMKRLEWLF